ncbi:MAG TPA: hypothetical protein VEI95_13245 [Acidobacteriota bacterium]|nr:hypothetical protein [Acidobacteriota bacterium]
MMWLLAAVLSCGLPFSSAEAEILIEARVGFHGVFQLGRPFPLEVELSNSGLPADGNLDVQVWKGGATKGGAPFAVKYRRPVFLAAQARKSVQLTVDPDFISRPLMISFTSSAGRASRELDLRRYFSPAPVLLLLSESNVLPPIVSLASGQNRLVAVSPSELAADPRALLGVSHLIIYDQSLRDMSRGQLAALDTWLTAGGRMIIIGSLNYALYQDPSLGRFLPVRVTGTKRISFTPGGSKKQRAGTLAGVWAQESRVISGQPTSESDGIPILVEASRGRGRITYFALDIGRPPLSQWEGLPKFLQSLLSPPGVDDASPRSEWNDAVFAQLVASPSFISTYVPSKSLFAATVLYLAGIGIIPWLGQRRRLKLRTLLVSLLALVSGGTMAGYLHFNHGGNIPDGVLMSSTLLESSGDGYVDAQANLALFSTQARPYDLEMERGWMDLTPVSNRAREINEAAVVQQDSSGASRFQLPLREWDYRLFRMQLVDRFDLRADFEAQGDKLLMRVRNQSNKDLTNCWLLVPGQRFDLGQIPRGANWSKIFPLTQPTAQTDAPVTRSDGVSFREIIFPDKTRDILFHSSYFPREAEARWASGAAVFFGWIKEPEPRVRIDDARIQTQDYALFRKIVPLAQGEDE